MVGRFIAMLALEEPTIVNLEELVSGLKDRVPQLAQEIVGRPYSGEKAAASEAYIVSVGGNHFAVAFVDRAAPDGTFETAAGYAEDVWPGASQLIRRHKGHVIISNLVASDGFDAAVDAAGSVTLIADMLNDLTPSLGVYWGNGEILQSPQQFRALTDVLIGGQPPVDAWINIRTHTDGSQPVAVSTLGLDSFCDREIETAVPSGDASVARGRVLAVACDILNNGPDLEDNCMIRIGEDDTVAVSLADSGLYQNQSVIMLTATAMDDSGTVDAGPEAATNLLDDVDDSLAAEYDNPDDEWHPDHAAEKPGPAEEFAGSRPNPVDPPEDEPEMFALRRTKNSAG